MDVINFIEKYGKSDPMESNRKLLLHLGYDVAWEESISLNVVKFFDELGNDFGYRYPLLTPEGVLEKNRKDFTTFAKRGFCHSTSYQIGREFPHNLHLYLGLVDIIEIHGGTEYVVGTVMHSFLHRVVMGFENKIYDPALLAEAFRGNTNCQGRNYFGVRIPYQLVSTLKELDPKRNYWGCLKKYIFSGNEETSEIIKLLRPFQGIYPEPRLLKTAT